MVAQAVQRLIRLVVISCAFLFAASVHAYGTNEQETLVGLKAQFPSAKFQQQTIPFPHWQFETATGETAYAFETIEAAPIPAYSGKPINHLVIMDDKGDVISVEVLEHHEPILLVGIPEKKLTAFVNQYIGLNIKQKIRVGSGEQEGQVMIDSITGATVTVIVVNQTVLRAARKLAKALKLPGFIEDTSIRDPIVKAELFNQSDWLTLTGDGSIRRLLLDYGQVDKAFIGTGAESEQPLTEEKSKKAFIDLWYAPINQPTIGRNLLGDDQYNWLQGELDPGDQAVVLMANGKYSFRGNGFVRGGIFDRVQLLQGDREITFRDKDYFRLNDVFIDGFPRLKERAIFIARAIDNQPSLNLARPWQMELLVRRQIGALDSEFVSFSTDYMLPDQYLDFPPPPVIEEEQPLWVEIWQQKQFQLAVLGSALILLTMVLFAQDWLVRRPKLFWYIRHGYLLFTLVFIGWYALGQLSIVNVFTFLHALLNNFSWDIFLLDPVIFMLWGFTAASIVLWGRGVFCGWLCPFGALQELINMAARALKIKQFEPPAAIHERLWAVKYIILLALFGLSLDSLATAERFAEVEPFKTSIMLKFSREWGFVLYSVILLVMSIFTRKLYCRYICPLGAALTIPGRFRIFDWLKRRKECGQPCQLCARECEIQAIEKDGRINPNECHHCLDCQVTYFNDHRCPPLVQQRKKQRKRDQANQIPVVETFSP
ncbi:transcriptional regulator NosR [Pelagibaculum spongiae]|uniref:Regulatory protein NosR n=1 Tax=Pelagibaculum spongiae TaxID=2080658 RepID=A0A2V1H123_9GAMM|nr:NosR/NirI family protein [Pelagibaculum spongiae]PVZ68999.1 regulatory protein NosR [Pelagibaculum spongiae]